MLTIPIDFNLMFNVFMLFLYYILYRAFKKVPHNGNLERQMKEVKADVETSFIELWDYIESTLSPLRMRLNTRLKRQEKQEEIESEDLKVTESLKKGGIIKGSDLKKHGIRR